MYGTTPGASKADTAPLTLYNPTDVQRHEMVRNSLAKVGRTEDYNNIINLLSPPPDITTYEAPGKYKGIKVAVVGAGLSGLCAAFELRKLGFDITIFEAEEQIVGGRVFTHYFGKDKKLYGEFGPMRIPAVHDTTWHYINLFKLNTSLFMQSDPNTFLYVRDVRVRNNPKEIQEKIYPKFPLTQSERNTPWPELYNQVINSVVKNMNPDVRAEVLKILPRYSAEYERYANISLFDTLKQAGLGNGAIDLITSLVPTANAFLYGGVDEELYVNYTVSFANMYRIDGGFINLPLAFYNSLNSENPGEYSNMPQSALGKVTFKMGQRVSEISKTDDDRKIALKVDSKLEPKGEYQTFDYVFLAVPLTALRKMIISPLFTELMMEAIREVFYIDAQKTIFLCKERFWEKQGIKGGSSYSDMIVQTIVYSSDYPEKTGYNINLPGIFTASYNLGHDALILGNTEDERLKLIMRQVEIVHGLPEGYLDSIIQEHKTVDWTREQFINGGFTHFYPGQRTRFFFDMFKPDYENRVYYAGEVFSPTHGWIQGALYTGALSANALAYYLKMKN